MDGWSFEMDDKLQLLPPPGPLAFVCAWPGRGIAASRVEVDGAAVREAAGAAVTLWTDDPYLLRRLLRPRPPGSAASS